MSAPTSDNLNVFFIFDSHNNNLHSNEGSNFLQLTLSFIDLYSIPVIMVIAIIIIINNLYCEEMNWIRCLCNAYYRPDRNRRFQLS